MIQDLPAYITVLFMLTVLGTIYGFYTTSRSNSFLLIATGWIVLQSLLALNGVYQDTIAIPPRSILFGILPTLVVIVFTFLTPSGKAFIDRLDLKRLTWFHSIRIPVEIVLVLLFHQGLVSQYMTYEGTNFDLLSGVSAPLVAYFAFRNARRNRKLLIAWNIVCLLLLFNVVITAALSLPSPFQQLAFDQPNIAVLYFPFNLLPAFIVPTVIFAHLAALRQLNMENATAVKRSRSMEEHSERLKPRIV